MCFFLHFLVDIGKTLAGAREINISQNLR